MNSEKTQELYTRIVFWFADHCPENWHKAHINIELLSDRGELAKSWVLSSYINEEEEDFDFDVDAAIELELVRHFVELFDLADNAGEAWSVCDFHVNNTGKYEVGYSYDEPPRLSGKDILAGT